MTIANTTTRAKPKARNGKGAKASAKTDNGNGTAAHINGANGTTEHAVKATTPARKVPITYSDEIADIIVARLEEGESLLSICSSADLPDESAVRKWAADPSHSFSPRYARAREVGYLKMADEVIALSDGLEAGVNRFEPGVVQRHRLMVDSRKWILSKALPKIYGDKISAEVTGADGAPVQIEAAAAIKALIEAMPELMNGKVELKALAAVVAPGEEGGDR